MPSPRATNDLIVGAGLTPGSCYLRPDGATLLVYASRTERRPGIDVVTIEVIRCHHDHLNANLRERMRMYPLHISISSLRSSAQGGLLDCYVKDLYDWSRVS